MVHGAPDNFNVQQKLTTFRLDDMAELAIRVGHPVSLDRLGEIIFAENFESGLVRCTTFTSGLGGSIIISGDKSRSGGFSCKMVAGSSLQKLARINIVQPLPIISNLGIEFHHTVNNNTDYFLYYFYIYDGTNKYLIDMKFDTTNKKLYLRDSTDIYIEIDDDFPISYSDIFYHGFKIVIDVKNAMYKRLITNHTTYNISNYSLYLHSASTLRYLNFFLQHFGIVDNNPAIYLDNIIITQNEP